MLVALEKDTAPSPETAASSRPMWPEGVKNGCLQVRCWAPIRPISGLQGRHNAAIKEKNREIRKRFS